MQEDNTNITVSTNFDVLIVAGGAVKGVSILGAIHYAFDNNLLNNINTFVGTSVGSMIVYFMSIGYTPIEIFKKIHKHKIFERLNASTNLTGMIGEGILPFTHIQEILEKMTIDKIGYYPTLKDIQNKFNKKLIMVTYNLSKDKIEYLTPDDNPDLPCLTAIRMSSNIPFLFEQFKYMGCYYIDGGIADNFPISYATKYGSNMIGFYTSSDNDSVSLDNNKIVSYIMKLMSIMPNIHLKDIIEKNKDKGTFINIVDDNPMLNFNLSTKDKLNLFSLGFNFSKKNLENLII